MTGCPSCGAPDDQGCRKGCPAITLHTSRGPFDVELYFEAHITIEPVFDERLDQFKAICKTRGFHVADLLMKKRAKDTLARSRFDTFATSRGQDFAIIANNTMRLIDAAREAGFVVWRYKIENTLVDERLT